MKKITLFLLLLPLLAMQCRKDKNDCPEGDKACELAKLPPLTTEGKGTFGCLVNGKAWLPESNTPVPKLRSTYHDEEQAYFLEAKYYDDNQRSTLLAFNIVQFSLIQHQYVLSVYRTDTISQGIYSVCWDNDGCSRNSFFTNEIETGTFTVSYVDSAKQIISGTFDFVAKASNGETVCVTDGRFDMLFNVH
jgi:hypothetical protein